MCGYENSVYEIKWYQTWEDARENVPARLYDNLV